jgi:phosphatidylglycerophosphate synthase
VAQSAKSHRTEWQYRIHRRISIYVTWVLLHTPLTANQASLLSLAVGFGAGGLVLCGDSRLALLGLVGFYAYFLLDKVDGEIARFRDERSLRGICLDYIGHMAIPPLVFLSMGGFLARKSGIGWFWLAGGLGALAVLFTRAAQDIPASMVLQKALAESDLFARTTGEGRPGSAAGEVSRPGLVSRAARLARFFVLFWPGLFLLACALAFYAVRQEFRGVLDSVFLALCALHLLNAAATGVEIFQRIDRQVANCLNRVDRIREDGTREP